MARTSLRRRRPVAAAPTTTVPRSRPIVASGRSIDVTDQQQVAAYRKRLVTAAWQEPAWVFNAIVPQLGAGHDYVRDSLGRIRPFPALLSDDPDEPPVAVNEDSAPDGLDPDLCFQIVQRLQPFPNFMGQSAQKLDIAGECYIGLIPDDDEIDGEICRVFSNRELRGSSDGWYIKEGPDDRAGTKIPTGTPFWRIWTPDPEWSNLPFSHMVRLNLVCERYLVLARLVKAFALSRLATTGKILVLADEFSLESATADGSAPTDDAGDGEVDTFFDDLMAAGSEAILDPESASAVMNLVIRGPHNLIKDGISVIDISRSMEETMLKLRDEAVHELALGINLPPEIILGIGATNHWNAEEIKQQAWLNYLEPRAYNILAATTSAFYRPSLLENGVDPEIVKRCVLWYDPTWFVGTPDIAESADFGLESGAIGWSSWRTAKGYSDDDAPDDIERAAYLAFQQALHVRTTVTEDTGGGEAPAVEEADLPKPGTPTEEPKVDVPEQPDTTAPADNPAAPTKKAAPKKATSAAVVPELIAASARPAPSAKLRALGGRQVAIERHARLRLMQAADGTVGRTLERAGVRVRSKLQSKAAGAAGKAALANLNGTPEREITFRVGRTVVESLGLNEQELLSGSLAALETHFYSIVTTAQHAAARAATLATGRDDFDYDQYDAKLDDDRKAGWGLLAAGLGGLAAAALYNPNPGSPDIGEYDGSSLVPPGLIRAALDRAGGAQVGQTTTVRGAPIPAPLNSVADVQDVSGGATAGPDVLAEFSDQLGITDDGYAWVYGDAPRREFEPHLNLDGVTFLTWEDDVLANTDGWPDYDFYFPGDHNGCECDAAVQYRQASETTALEPGLGVIRPEPLTRTQQADALDAPRTRKEP